MPKAFAAKAEGRKALKTGWRPTQKDIEIVAKQNADWDRQKSKDLADTWIKQYPDLNAIFCNNDTMALGVVEAVKSSGKDILVVGVDGIEERRMIPSAGASWMPLLIPFPFYKAQIAGEVMLRRLGGQGDSQGAVDASGSH